MINIQMGVLLVHVRYKDLRLGLGTTLTTYRHGLPLPGVVLRCGVKGVGVPQCGICGQGVSRDIKTTACELGLPFHAASTSPSGFHGSDGHW